VVGAAGADVPGTIVGAPVDGDELGPGTPEVAAATASGGGGVAQAAARSSTVAVRVAVTAPHTGRGTRTVRPDLLSVTWSPSSTGNPDRPRLTLGLRGYFFAAVAFDVVALAGVFLAAAFVGVLVVTLSATSCLNDAERIHRYSDVRAFTSQGPSRLEVLASERDPHKAEAFSEQDYRQAVSTTWLLITLGVLILVVLVVMVMLGRRVFARRDGRAAMKSASSVAGMTGREAKQRGKALRPSLAGADRTTRMSEYGSLLGTVGREPVYKSWEDVAVVFMGPRSNKTSAIAVPGILSAPGAVVATSNKPDLWMLTAALRAEGGDVYVLDPQRIAFVPQTWWWNPLSAVTDIDSAERLAGHFMREVDGGGGTSSGSSAFFNRAASQTLQRLILAAAVSGRSVRDVASWIATRSPEPVSLLADHGFGELADAHEADLEGPVETRGGIYATVAAAVSCLNVESVARWITPPSTWRDSPTEPIAEFDPWTLVASEVGGRHPTLYLLSREGSGTSRVLVAALVDRVFEVAGLAATARGGRVDPPITVMLDEAANVCRIDALPDLYSFFGSQGISVTTILHSYKQGVRVWGKDGMDALWSPATVAIAGAGLKDMEFCKTLSDLVGQHESTSGRTPRPTPAARGPPAPTGNRSCAPRKSPPYRRRRRCCSPPAPPRSP